MEKNETNFVMLVKGSQNILLCPENDGSSMLSPDAYLRYMYDNGIEYDDAYDVRQDELQFYCIDERITVTDEENGKIARYLL